MVSSHSEAICRGLAFLSLEAWVIRSMWTFGERRSLIQKLWRWRTDKVQFSLSPPA